MPVDHDHEVQKIANAFKICVDVFFRSYSTSENVDQAFYEIPKLAEPQEICHENNGVGEITIYLYRNIDAL